MTGHPLSVHLVVWLGRRGRWTWPLTWLIYRAWWPVCRGVDHLLRDRLGFRLWQVKARLYRLLHLGCPVHHMPKIAGGGCVKCFQDRLVQAIKLDALRGR